MKKIFGLLVLCLFVLPVFASADFSNVNKGELNLSQKEKQYFLDMGFNEKEIFEMTKEEYAELKARYNGISGKVESVKEKYYKVIDDILVTEITKAEFEKEEKLLKAKSTLVKSKNNGPVIAYGNTVSTSSFKLVTTTTKMYNSYGQYLGRVQLKNTFTWLKAPTARFIDVMGFSWGSTASYYSSSGSYLNYKVDGVKTYTSRTLDKNDPDGVAFKVDLYEGPAPYHSGYMLSEITKNSSTALNVNVYGHYIHTISPTWISNISIGAGAISITGPTADSTYKTDQLLTWP